MLISAVRATLACATLAFVASPAWAQPSAPGPSEAAPSEATPATRAPRAAPEPNPERSAALLIQQGLRRRRHGDDAGALVLFQRALALRPTGRHHAQVGLAHQALGQWRQAETHIQAALEATGDRWVRRYRRALRRAQTLVRRHLGALEISADVEGAEVFFDGRPVGHTPLPVQRLERGRITVELNAPGYYAAGREVWVSAGQTVREHFELHPRSMVADAARASEATPPPGPVRAAVRQTARSPSGPPRLATSRSVDRPAADPTLATLGGVVVALGASGLGLALTGFLFRADAAARWNDDARCLSASLTRDQICGADREEAEAWESVTLAALVGGSVAVGAGLVILMVGLDQVSKSSRTAARCVPTGLSTGPASGLSTGLGLACRGWF